MSERWGDRDVSEDAAIIVEALGGIEEQLRRIADALGDQAVRAEPTSSLTRIYLTPGTWFRKVRGTGRKTKWHRVALTGWRSEHGYCECHTGSSLRGSVELETRDDPPPETMERCRLTVGIAA